MKYFDQFKMRCDFCDRIGTIAVLKNSELITLSMLLQAGWKIRTRSLLSGTETDLRVLCPDCAAKSMAHHESWKKDVTP